MSQTIEISEEDAKNKTEFEWDKLLAQMNNFQIDCLNTQAQENADKAA